MGRGSWALGEARKKERKKVLHRKCSTVAEGAAPRVRLERCGEGGQDCLD